MAVFVRPATWSYDQELFRSATADEDKEDKLEAMLGAIALADDLWTEYFHMPLTSARSSEPAG